MSATIRIPPKLPCLHVTDGVVFPGISHKIPVRAQQNINMIEERLLDVGAIGSRVICMIYNVSSNEIEKDKRKDNSFYAVGVAAVVTQVVGTNWPRPSYTIQVVGLCRLKIEQILQTKPYIIAETCQIDKKSSDEKVDKADVNLEYSETAKRFRATVTKFLQAVKSSGSVNVQKLKRVLSSASLDSVTDLTAAIVEASYDEKLAILGSVELTKRMELLEKLLQKQIKKVENLTDDDKNGFTVAINPILLKNNDEFSQNIQNFLNKRRPGNPNGSSQTDGESPQNALLVKLKEAKMPPEVESQVMDDYKRMSTMLTFMPEYSMLRNYLELVAVLPWNKETKDTLDLINAKKCLEEDHYGLADVKKRILEYLAVRRLNKSLKGPILCFTGPPGVGKTSVGRSIARTLGRKFHRVSLGGVCDQSDIRGHRRTYIAAMCGRIINGLKLAQSKNPVFLLDEVDKMTVGSHGDPAAALLEVLDPEQNSTFVDHYLNVPFDLSQVLFIATANSADNIPAPLLDRMEAVKIEGYTIEEKIKIGEKYLIPKQMKEHGLCPEHVQLPVSVLDTLVSKYTSESGVRSFERKIGAIMRAVALKLAEGLKSGVDSIEQSLVDKNFTSSPIVIDEPAVFDILGPPPYVPESRDTTLSPGVAAGLAWSSDGGTLLYVETSKMEGDGRIKLTGQLGDVMQESVHIALSWLLSHAHLFNLRPPESGNLLEKINLHVHFPSGSVNKDGPSAGITVVTALVSLFTNKPMRSDTAMTGEVNLRGQVLEVGGIKEKLLVAYRSGFTRIILPRLNENDTLNLPTEAKAKMSFVYVNSIEEAIEEAFEGGLPKLEAPAVSKL